MRAGLSWKLRRLAVVQVVSTTTTSAAASVRLLLLQVHTGTLNHHSRLHVLSHTVSAVGRASAERPAVSAVGLTLARELKSFTLQAPLDGHAWRAIPGAPSASAPNCFPPPHGPAKSAEHSSLQIQHWLAQLLLALRALALKCPHKSLDRTPDTRWAPAADALARSALFFLPRPHPRSRLPSNRHAIRASAS